MKLDDLHKKNIFQVPERYFSKLPERVQARVSAKRPDLSPVFNWNLAFKIVPITAVLVVVLYFGVFRSTQSQDPIEMIAMVSSEDIIAYLELTDITTDEIIEGIDLEMIDFDLEDSFLLDEIEVNDNDLDQLIETLELESELL